MKRTARRVGMSDLHAHTFHSDGDLCPAELLVRAEHAGITALAITDHVDWSTVETTVPALVAACRAENSGGRLLAVPGAELTHVRPAQIGKLAERCRQLGARIVLVHGETIVEPVPAGTNRAAIEAGVDVLAHPGLLSAGDARLAAARGVRLEISGRAGHSLTNGHVARLAAAHGARLSFGSDSHAPDDLCGPAMAESVLRGAGLSAGEALKVLQSGLQLLAGRGRAPAPRGPQES